MSLATRYLITLSDDAISQPEGTQKVLDSLHHVVGSTGEVLDSAPDDRSLIEVLGTVVVEAPTSFGSRLKLVPGVARVDEDTFRSLQDGD